MGEVNDWLTNRTRKYVREMYNGLLSPVSTPNPDVDLITFTNPQLTEGTLSDGTPITTVPKGRPKQTDAGIKLDNSTYLITGAEIKPQVISGPSGGGVMLIWKNTEVFISKLGDSTLYKWIDTPTGSAPNVFGNSGLYLDMTPDGRNLVYIKLDRQLANNSTDYTAVVYKNFFPTPGATTISSTAVYSASGNIDPFRNLANAMLYSYTKSDGKVYIDFVTMNNSTLGGIITTYTTGICPEDNNPGTQTQSTLAALFGSLFFTGVYSGGTFTSRQLFRSLNNDTAMNILTDSFFNFTSAVYGRYLWSSIPVLAEASPIFGTASAPQSNSLVVTDTQMFKLEEINSQINPNASPVSVFRPYYPRVKAVDSNRYFRQIMVNFTDDPTIWEHRIELVAYNDDTASFDVLKSKSGIGPVLFEQDKDGTLTSPTDYSLVAIAIQGAVGNVQS